MPDESIAMGFSATLEAELESVVMPQADPTKASTEELIKDIHRVLAGNGGPQRGVIYKVASATAHVKTLDSRLQQTRDIMFKQQQDCHTRHTDINKQLGNVEGVFWKRLVGFVWNNKGMVILSILVIAQLAMGYVRAAAPVTKPTPDYQALYILVAQLQDAMANIPATAPAAPEPGLQPLPLTTPTPTDD